MDPDSSESQAPLLFADCKGLDGSEHDKVGTILKSKLASSQNKAYSSLPKLIIERDLVQENSPKKQSRDSAVAHLYPDLLYTFSDVIVFVSKYPRYVSCSALTSWHLLPTFERSKGMRRLMGQTSLSMSEHCEHC